MELVTLIKDGGPYALAAVLGFLYWAERNDRKESQRALIEFQTQIVERVVTALNATSQATRDVNATIATLNTTFQNVLFRLRDRADDGAQ